MATQECKNYQIVINITIMHHVKNKKGDTEPKPEAKAK